MEEIDANLRAAPHPVGRAVVRQWIAANEALADGFRHTEAHRLSDERDVDILTANDRAGDRGVGSVGADRILVLGVDRLVQVLKHSPQSRGERPGRIRVECVDDGLTQGIARRASVFLDIDQDDDAAFLGLAPRDPRDT